MGVSATLKRVLVGRKLASRQLGETLLPKRIALPVFASDALSSVAYAPDEILLTLSLAGAAGLAWSGWVGLSVAAVMLVVIASYRQTVRAYPRGGGAYEVARVNLGTNASLVVGSALLVDYVLTVAVSVSAGVANASTLLGWLRGHEPLAATVVIVLLGTVNLRGVRESGRAFAVPTYCFILGVFAMTAVGWFRVGFLGDRLRAPSADLALADAGPMAGLAFVGLAIRAFSSGCAALTGVEAIANCVPSFRPPKSEQAAKVLTLLGALSVTMLMGSLALAGVTGVRVGQTSSGHNTAPVTAQLAAVVFGDWFAPAMVFVVVSTTLILAMAANTAFSGFPVLGSILSRDGWLPRQLHTRGDRLAFSNGILALMAGAVALVWVFDASVTHLIQLYVVGVFVAFTIGQFGMVRHWTRAIAELGKHGPRPQLRRMRRARAINAIGLVATSVVLVAVVASKLTHGAYLTLLAMAGLFWAMRWVGRQYRRVAAAVELTPGSDRALPSRVRAVVLVTDLNKPTMRALTYARATRPSELTAVCVDVDPDQTAELLERWDAERLDVTLLVLASPYREITEPFVSMVKGLRSENPRDLVCVYIPEFVTGHWWQQLLHNQTALMIRVRLHFMSGVMVTSVPYQLRSTNLAEPKPS